MHENTSQLKIILMQCAIWYHFVFNLKNVKNTHGGVLPLASNTLKVTLLHGCFSRSLKCKNGTKSHTFELFSFSPINLSLMQCGKKGATPVRK